MIEFLNQPIVLTLISLVIGGYLLSIIAERRARKDKVREKAIEFLTETGDAINGATSLIYEQIWTENIQNGPELQEKIGILFTKRMSVQVKSLAYLNSEDFYRQYNQLVWELEGVRYFLAKIAKGDSQEEIITQIQERKNRLGNSWPIEPEMLDPRGKPPFDELMTWMQMIGNRVTALLSSSLKSALS